MAAPSGELAGGMLAMRPRWRGGSIPPTYIAASAATVGCLVVLQQLRSRFRKAYVTEVQRRREAAIARVRERLPPAARAVAAGEEVAAAGSTAQRLASGADELVSVLSAAGGALRGAFPAGVDAAASASDASAGDGAEEDDTCAVSEFLLAWREVGEAVEVYRCQLIEAAHGLRAQQQKLESERSRCAEEALQLTGALADAEVEAEDKAAPRGFMSRMVFGAPISEEQARADQEQLQLQRAMTSASLQRIVDRLEELRSEATKCTNKCVADMRRPARFVGERLLSLKPSRGGIAAAASAAGLSPKSQGKPKGARIEALSRQMKTAEGRQQLREAEAAEEAAREGESPPRQDSTAMLRPPVQKKEEGEWRIRGVYRHQVLKTGLRRLDEEWATDGLFQFPQPGLMDVGRGLMREKLFQEMLGGTIRLQSVPINDVAAAQRDLQKLSLRQLLRLRVQHIDFVPSGCGADAVSTLGSTHEAFLTMLDGRLFRLLGQKAIGERSASAAGAGAAEEDAHRLGVEAVLFAAGASAIPEPRWWCWWLSEERHIFLDPLTLESRSAFPDSGGVLEVTDFSKSDKHEPTGKLQWFDWRVCAVSQEAHLSAGPLVTAQAAAPATTVSGGASSLPDAATGSASGGVGGAVGANTSSRSLGMSPEMLKDVRSSLKKVQR